MSSAAAAKQYPELNYMGLLPIPFGTGISRSSHLTGHRHTCFRISRTYIATYIATSYRPPSLTPMTPTREYSSSRFPRPPFPTSRLEVLSRFEPHANGQSTSAVHFVPGGAWLVSLSNCRPNSLSKTDPIAAQITVWNLHSLASPRCTLKLIREDLNFDESALLVDRESGIATLALTSSQTLDERRTWVVDLTIRDVARLTVDDFRKLIVYRLPLLDEGSLTHPAEPEAVINDLWLPTHPSAGEEPGSAVMALELSKNVIASSIRDISQVDEDEQFNPKLPPGGTDQIYLLHTPTSKGRWLHPRFVEVLPSCPFRATIVLT